MSSTVIHDDGKFLLCGSVSDNKSTSLLVANCAIGTARVYRPVLPDYVLLERVSLPGCSTVLSLLFHGFSDAAST